MARAARKHADPYTAVQSPPTTKGRDTRQRILSSAEQLFADRGYAPVRITDITDAAGLSAGSFYRYFADRRELTLEMLKALTAEAYDFVRVPWDDSDPMSSVVASTQRYFEFYERHHALFGVLVELAQTDPEVAEIWAGSRKSFYDRIANSMTRGIKAGVLRPGIDVRLAAELLGSMSEFYAFQRFVLGGSAIKAGPLEQAARVLADIWTNGVASPDLAPKN